MAELIRENEITNGCIVKHFKKEIYTGENDKKYLYRVINTDARHVDDISKRLVVYEALYSDGDAVKEGDVFIRDYDEFISLVDKVKYPNIKQTFRFEVVQ